MNTYGLSKVNMKGMSVMLLILSLALMSNAQLLIGEVCTDSNYNGDCQYIYSNTQISTFSGGLGNNQISSMQFIAPGYYVRVFENTNWLGSYKVYRTPIARTNLNVESPNWNDRIESLSVTEVPIGTPGVTVFKDANQQSECEYYEGPGNYPDLSLVGFSNNLLSSILIYEYTVVYLFNGIGGINLCPDTSCAIWTAATTFLASAWNMDANDNDKTDSLYIGPNQTPTTTTAAVTTTQAATTTAAVAATTAAVTTTVAATTAAVTTTQAAHVAVTTSVHAATVQAAGKHIGGMARNNAKDKLGGTGHA